VTTDQIVEEPCEVKISSTVLKTSRRGDLPAEFISLSSNRKQITFTDKKGIGKLKLKGTWDLNFYQIDQIKRVRLVRRE
jgi:putative transposase